jgi:hypothetical protein
MATWILRKSVDGERVGAPRRCESTQEEQTAALLASQEKAAEVIDGQRKIYLGQQLVGYIVVLSAE